MTAMKKAVIRLRTLGRSRIEIGATAVGPDSELFFGFVLYLAVERGRPVPRGRLRELFWPQASEEKARHSLRQLLYRLRQLEVDVQASAGHVTLPASQVDVDFARVADHLAAPAGESGGGG